ncbi:MAG: glycosyltransferase family 39 protein [Endomicrobiaceae bacterium]|nr:glycosyltransferase family 39 protein [Endomicrobiaceae bacterium]
MSYELSGTDDDVFTQITFKNYSLGTTFNIFLKDKFSYYRPALLLSFMVDNFISGSSPQALHTTNVLLHAISCILLFFFLKNYYFNSTLSFLSTVLFAVHPINIFSVAWIPGRNDLLLFIFLILSIILLIEYTKTEKKYFFILHYIAFLSALITKEVSIVMPLIYIFYCLSTNITKKKLLNLIVLWISASLFLFLIHFVISSKMFTLSHYLNNLFATYKSLFDYYGGAYFLKIHFSSYFSNYHFYIGILAFCLSFLFAFYSRLKTIEKIFYFTFPLAILLICMLSGQFFYQGNRMYIPLVCFLIPFCSFINRLNNKKIVYSIFTIIILASFFITMKQSAYFENSLTFLKKTDSERPNYSIYMANLYSYNLLKSGLLEEGSIKIKEIAESTNYKDKYNLYLLSIVYMHEHKYENAIKLLSNIVNFDKQDIYVKLYICYDNTGDIEKRNYYKNLLIDITGNLQKADFLISHQQTVFKKT